MTQQLRTTKTSKFRNVLLLLLVVFLFAFVAYQNIYKREAVITQGPISKEELLGTRQATIISLNDKFGASTIEYYDQDYGFSLRYPIGYSATQDAVEGVKVRFGATFVPFQAEVYDVRVLNYSSLSEEDIREAAQESNALVLEGRQDNRPFYAYTATEPSPFGDNETILVRQAFLECEDLQEKPYWLSITAAFTQALTPDLEIAEFMISSVKC